MSHLALKEEFVPQVDVWVGKTPDQIEAWYELHKAWRFENTGTELDKEEWAKHFYSVAVDPERTLVVAWVDGTPVGVLEFFLYYDLLKDKSIGIGDRAFVLPEWRGSGVMAAMFRSIYGLAQTSSAEIGMFHARGEDSGYCLKDYYSRMGARLEGYVMEIDL